MIWNVLSGVAIIALVVSFFLKGKNAIWGMLGLGIVAAIIVLVINLILGNSFNRLLMQAIVTVSVLIGTVAEIIGRVSKSAKK